MAESRDPYKLIIAGAQRTRSRGLLSSTVRLSSARLNSFPPMRSSFARLDSWGQLSLRGPSDGARAMAPAPTLTSPCLAHQVIGNCGTTLQTREDRFAHVSRQDKHPANLG